MDQQNSDQIVVSYADPEGPVALAVVNAVLEAYRDIRRELTDIVADEAVNRVDAELKLLDQRLATISADIEELKSTNPLAEDLAGQAVDAVTRIGVLQAELDSSTDPERRSQIIDELGDLRARVDLFLNMQSATRSRPELESCLLPRRAPSSGEQHWS